MATVGVKGLMNSILSPARTCLSDCETCTGWTKSGIHYVGVGTLWERGIIVSDWLSTRSTVVGRDGRGWLLYSLAQRHQQHEQRLYNGQSLCQCSGLLGDYTVNAPM